MSDTAPEATTTNEEVVVENTTPKTLEEALAEAEKWKHFSRKNEQEKNALLEKAEKWQQYEESQKTELQKLQDQVAAEKAAASSALTEAAKLRLGLEYGFGEQHLKLLSGSTPEELKESAETLKAILGGTTPTDTKQRVVIIPSTQGGSESVDALSPREQAKAWIAQRRSG